MSSLYTFQLPGKKQSLAKKHKSLSNIVFIEVNAKMLEHVHIPEVHQFPTIKLFNLINPQGIDFNQERTLKIYFHFIKQHADKIVKGGKRQRTRRDTRKRTRQRTRQRTELHNRQYTKRYTDINKFLKL